MGILLALMLTGQAWAAIDTWQFKDEAQEQAFREITSQLRCPKRDDCRRYAAEGVRADAAGENERADR